MKQSEREIIGQLGETYFAKNILDGSGRLARFGTGEFNLPAHLQHSDIPIIPDSSTGHRFFSCSNGDKFDSDNFKTSEYIRRFYWKWSNENPLPYSGKQILEAAKNGEKDRAERMKNENRAAMKRFPGHGDHPGRYDFITIVDSTYSAVEVKANGGRLSYWQKVRLGLLSLLGNSCFLAKVNVTYEALLDLKSTDFEQFSLELLDINQFIDIELPSLAEMEDVLRYQLK